VPRRAALFDLDKTLLQANSGHLFMQFRRRRGEVGLRRMLQVGFWLLQYSWGRVDAERVARKVMGEYRGTPEKHLEELCEGWVESEVLPLISPRARLVVKSHQSAGDLVAIVTSSTRYGTAPVARELGIEHVLCTELEVREEIFTGEVVKPLCYGEGKVIRSRELLNEHGVSFSDATFYSDSVTDLPLMNLVGRAVAVNPDKGLRRYAQKQGWAIEQW